MAIPDVYYRKLTPKPAEKALNAFSEEKVQFLSVCKNGQIYLKFPKEFRRRAAALLEAQMWAFGSDIKNPASNLLTQFGFIKKSPDCSQSGTSSYILNIGDDYRITLWGFAVIISSTDHGSIIIRRHCFTPLWSEGYVTAENCFNVFSLPIFHEPLGSDACLNAVRLLKEFIKVLYSYEQWVNTYAGTIYRRAILRRGQRPVRRLASLSLAAEWQRIYNLI